jgi:hypothetical protein
VQHSANQRIETRLDMRVLQSPATLDRSLIAGAGQRFESARRLSILWRFAGKTRGSVFRPGLVYHNHTATRQLKVLSITLAIPIRASRHTDSQWLHLVRAPADGALLTMLADTMMPEAFRYRGKQVSLVTTLGFALAFSITTSE